MEWEALNFHLANVHLSFQVWGRSPLGLLARVVYEGQPTGTENWKETLQRPSDCRGSLGPFLLEQWEGLAKVSGDSLESVGSVCLCARALFLTVRRTFWRHTFGSSGQKGERDHSKGRAGLSNVQFFGQFLSGFCCFPTSRFCHRLLNSFCLTPMVAGCVFAMLASTRIIPQLRSHKQNCSGDSEVSTWNFTQEQEGKMRGTT